MVNERALTEDEQQKLRGITNEDGTPMLPEKLCDALINNGSIADFSGMYTVFAQTIEGMDVIESICNAQIDEKTLDPVTPITITKVTLGEYHAG